MLVELQLVSGRDNSRVVGVAHEDLANTRRDALLSFIWQGRGPSIFAVRYLRPRASRSQEFVEDRARC